MFKTRDWVRAGNYDICVHDVLDVQIPKHAGPASQTPALRLPDGTLVHVSDEPEMQRVVYINVEYRNNSKEKNLSCRRNQWYLFDAEGYSYEALSNSDYIYDKQGRRYMGGERFLNPGTNIRGWIAFEVPDAVQIARIQFVSGFLRTNTADIQI